MIKISGAEKLILALTALFLLLTGGYFLLESGGEGYSVREQQLWSSEVGAGAQTPGNEAGRVNINTAGVDELQTLPGIGQVIAGRIVAERQENGPYRIPEDIMRVSGIGQGTLEEILDYITVG